MFKRYASTTIIEARMGGDSRGMLRTAHRHNFNYIPKEGMLYVRSRAISSRCNDNFDFFGAEDIAKSYQTFVGKPVFVNHHNDNHRRMRGVIIDAALHRDVNPDGSPDTWAEVLMEVDAVRYPKLAKAILAGHVDRTSMGCDVELSKCSICHNIATSPLQYCAHIPGKKGKRIYQVQPDGSKVGKLVYEICSGLSFFENSLLVEQPADPTAFFLGQPELGPGLEHLASSIQATASGSRLGLMHPVASDLFTPEDFAPFTRTASRKQASVVSVWDLIKQADLSGDDLLDADFHVEAKQTKPIGEMNESELADHRAKQDAGKKWNEENPVHHQHIIDHWNQSTPEEKHEGESWYADAHHLAKHIANDTGHDVHTVAGLISNYSPQTHWSTNMMTAAKVARTRTALGGKGSGIMASENQRNAAHRMLTGEHYDSVLGGPKTKAFAHLIEHGKNADASDPKVVVDRHALSVAAGSRASDAAYSASKLGTKKRYNEVSQAYHKAAQHISKQEGRPIEAHQVQAATWLTRQRLNQEHDRALSQTASSSSASRAVSATKEWNKYAGEHHPGLMGKEPGTGYSASEKEQPEDIQHAKQLDTEKSPLTKQAYGETKAPRDVDTLRAENCTVCGNSTAFDGKQCQICGYVAPPKEFGDPDTDMAKQMDLRKQILDGGSADPTDLDQPMGNQQGDPEEAEQQAEDANAGLDSGSGLLNCTNCGTGIQPAPAQTTSESGEPPYPAEGDTCPVCKNGELLSGSEGDEEETDPEADPEADPEEDSDAPQTSEDEDEEEDADDKNSEDDDDEDSEDEDPKGNPFAKKKSAWFHTKAFFLN